VVVDRVDDSAARPPLYSRECGRFAARFTGGVGSN